CQTLVVGDMDVDILMGANAGTKTCGVTYGNGTKKELEEVGADYVIDNIEELMFLCHAPHLFVSENFTI
ncbi:MAG: HAD family hydrolase, partial [Bacteroidales bacterium]|nr:HAD family hydrolase [Bacteroidales bacterium]